MKESIRRLFQPLRRSPAPFHAIRKCFHPGPAIYKHLYFYGPFTVPVSTRASFVVNHFGYQVENELFWAGFERGYEGMELRLWRALMPYVEFVADVGANTGVYVLAAAALNPRAKIVALEPVSRIYKKLVANLALNSFDVRAMEIAASDSDGEAVLFDTDGEHNYSASLDATMVDSDKTLRIPVRAARLDSLFDEMGWPRIDLLKIDVEKHEPAVLKGMRKRLAQDGPIILIEILNDEIGVAVASVVEEFDYRFFAIDATRGLVETKKLMHQECRNYLLCRSEQWERLGARVLDALALGSAR
jgi:FkbM family methyltransferase